jgi:hypothetical protein
MRRWNQIKAIPSADWIMNEKFKICLLLLALSSGLNWSLGQGTAFSYQGHLLENGVPANGAHDFAFGLFDAAAAGNQIGPALPLNAVPVSNGQFNVTLDFGAAAFPGNPRWLEISVRTAGVGQFTKMDARVSLLPTPYAIFAAAAGTLANGTVAANQLNTGGVAPTAGQFLSYSGGNLSWSDPGVAIGNIWSRNGADTYYSAGNVGIGTSTPTLGVRLEVNGNARVTPGGSGGFVQIGTPNGETGLSFQGANRADIRYDGSILKLVAGTVGPPSPSAGIAIDPSGNVGIGTTTPGSKLAVAGDVTQARDKSGFVKAMLYVNADGTIARCYNGMTNATARNCGFTIANTYADWGADHVINFGSRVTDRFISVSAEWVPGFASVGASYSFDPDPDLVHVQTFTTEKDYQEFTGHFAFMIIVY